MESIPNERFALAVTPDAPHKGYLLSGYGEGGGSFGGFYVSSNLGISFTQVVNFPNIDPIEPIILTLDNIGE